jgi:hypothetical protein
MHAYTHAKKNTRCTILKFGKKKKSVTTEKRKKVGNGAYFNISDYSSIREDCVNPSHNLNNKQNFITVL